MEAQLMNILQERHGEPFSHSELLKLAKIKSRAELKEMLEKLIKKSPNQFGSKKIGRITVVWAKEREAKDVSPTVSDEIKTLKKQIAHLEKENKKLKEAPTKKKEKVKKEKPSKPEALKEIKEKLLDDLVDTLTEEFPRTIATKDQLKRYFMEVLPFVLDRYF